MPLIKRILSIDDQASICQMIQFTMSDLSDERIQYEVDVASDGSSGLDMAKNTQYDLIITDQKMPGDVDGLTVIRSLKAMPEYKNTPIVMLTMETTEAMKNAARSVGATGFKERFWAGVERGRPPLAGGQNARTL